MIKMYRRIEKNSPEMVLFAEAYHCWHYGETRHFTFEEAGEMFDDYYEWNCTEPPENDAGYLCYYPDAMPESPCGILEFSFQDGKSKIEIEMPFVKEAHRRQGIMQQMLKHLIAHRFEYGDIQGAARNRKYYQLQCRTECKYDVLERYSRQFCLMDGAEFYRVVLSADNWPQKRFATKVINGREGLEAHPREHRYFLNILKQFHRVGITNYDYESFEFDESIFIACYADDRCRKIVGMMSAEEIASWFVQVVCVSPDARRQGVFSSMLAELAALREEKQSYGFGVVRNNTRMTTMLKKRFNASLYARQAWAEVPQTWLHPNAGEANAARPIYRMMARQKQYLMEKGIVHG